MWKSDQAYFNTICHYLLAMYQPETLSKPIIASPCETLRENCRKEQVQVQERCKTVQVQVKVLHRKVLEALHTLLSSLRKSPTQRPCLEELHHSFKFIFVWPLAQHWVERSGKERWESVRASEDVDEDLGIKSNQQKSRPFWILLKIGRRKGMRLTVMLLVEKKILPSPSSWCSSVTMMMMMTMMMMVMVMMILMMI